MKSFLDRQNKLQMQPNIGRLAALRAGLPVEVPGYTVHRQCGSSLQAINNGAQQIACRAE